MSPMKYIKEAASNCKKHLKSNYGGRYVLPTQAANPFVMGYEPELDETPTLDPDRASYLQSIIRVMRWMCEIGCINIATEILLPSLHLAYPREGHLDAALHVMGYLRLKYNSGFFLTPLTLLLMTQLFSIMIGRSCTGTSRRLFQQMPCHLSERR
jgi:hypothetical protein